jgi:hypothetical protein
VQEEWAHQRKHLLETSALVKNHAKSTMNSFQRDKAMRLSCNQDAIHDLIELRKQLIAIEHHKILPKIKKLTKIKSSEEEILEKPRPSTK